MLEDLRGPSLVITPLDSEASSEPTSNFPAAFNFFRRFKASWTMFRMYKEPDFSHPLLEIRGQALPQGAWVCGKDVAVEVGNPYVTQFILARLRDIPKKVMWFKTSDAKQLLDHFGVSSPRGATHEQKPMFR
jgi:hypothetical protein